MESQGSGTKGRVGTLLVAAVGVVHLLPGVGILSRAQLEQLYDVSVEDPATELLPRHRAVFFALVGPGLLVGAVVARHRSTAVVAGLLSLASYVGLASVIDHQNDRLEAVRRVDLVLVAALVVGSGLARTRSDGAVERLL